MWTNIFGGHGTVRCLLLRLGLDCSFLLVPLVTWRRLMWTMRSTASWHLLECQNASFCHVCPLNCSCVRCGYSRSFAAFTWCITATSGPRCGFFLGSLFLSEDGGKLRPTTCSWIATGPCDDSGFDLFWGLCWRCLCSGLWPPEGSKAALEAVKGDLGRCWLAVLFRLRLTHRGKYSKVFGWITRREFCRWKPLASHGCGVVWSTLTAKASCGSPGGHITWRRLPRRLALSLINAGYRFARTFGPRSGRVWPAVAQEFRYIASLLPLLTCSLASPWSPWVYATDASGDARVGYGVTPRGCDPDTVAAACSCAGRWRFSAEEFISARRSVLIENEWTAQKAAWLWVVDEHEDNRVDLHPSLLWSMQESLHLIPCVRAVFETVPSIILQPKSAWCVLFGGVWRKSVENLRGERVKPMSWGCAMLVGPLKAWENGCCSCWTTWPWFWVLRRVAVARQTSTPLVAKFVSSLSPRSSSPFADGLRQKRIWPMSHLAPSFTARACTPMLTSVGQQPAQSEDLSGELQGEPEGFQPTESTDDAEARADLWSIQSDFHYRHHNELRCHLCVPKEETFPIPLKFIDVTRSTYTDLDMLQENRKDDCWNVNANGSLSDSWKVFTKFTLLKENLQKDTCAPGWGWQKFKQLPDLRTCGLKYGSMDQDWKSRSEERNRKGKKEKPQFDNARRLRGIHLIDPDDGDCKETLTHAMRKLEVPMEAAMPCKNGTSSKKNSSSPPQETEKRGREPYPIPKTIHACIVEAHGSTRQQLESSLPKNHEDHFAGKGYTSMTHYNLVHKFIPIPQAMKILDARSSSGQGMEEARDNFGLAVGRSQKQEGGYSGSTKRQKRESILLHRCDICRFKNAEMEEPKHQKILRTNCVPRWHCKGRFRFPCSLYWTGLVCVPDDCRKSNGCYCKITRLWRTSSSCSISLHPSKNWRTLPNCTKFQNQNVQTYGHIFHDTHGRNLGQTLKILWYLSNDIYMDTASCGKDNLRKFCWNLDWRKVPKWECLFVHRRQWGFLSV